MFNMETADLTLAMIPDADEEQLREFARTFSGYTRAGSFARCAEIARSPDHDSIDELRITLFYRYRALRHTGAPVTEEWIRDIRGIVGRIRELVAARHE